MKKIENENNKKVPDKINLDAQCLLMSNGRQNFKSLITTIVLTFILIAFLSIKFLEESEGVKMALIFFVGCLSCYLVALLRLSAKLVRSVKKQGDIGLLKITLNDTSVEVEMKNKSMLNIMLDDVEIMYDAKEYTVVKFKYFIFIAAKEEMSNDFIYGLMSILPDNKVKKTNF